MKKALRLVVAGIVVLGAATLWAADDEGYALIPGPSLTVTIDQSVSLRVVSVSLVSGIHPVDVLEAVQWTANGQSAVDSSEGKLTVDLTMAKATYTAPHTVPKVNPVAIAVSIPSKGANKTKETLICNITVVDRVNLFNLTGPGSAMSLYQLDDRYSNPQVQAMLARAYMAGPELAVNVSAMQPGGAGGGERNHSNATMALFVNGTDVGEHAWTLPTTTVMLTIAGNKSEMYSTGDCLPHGDNHCKPVSTKGVTRITTFDRKTNEVIGTFDGQVVKLEDGRPTTYAQASGAFKTTLQGLAPGMK